MSERTDEGTTTDAVDFVTIKQKEIISMQLQKSICKIKGKTVRWRKFWNGKESL